MGVTKNCIKFLMYSKQLGVSYSNTLTLGRLTLYAKKSEILNLAMQFKIDTANINSLNFSNEQADSVFKLLGASKLQSLDYSTYENADIVQDLNAPWPNEYDNSFSVIFDGGTLEHVFNFPVAIKSCMKSLKIGGHFISITNANNDNGHGFYQFSPELFYRIFSKENGFKVKLLILSPSEKNWYRVADPNTVKSRVLFVNSEYTRLLVIAEKISNEEVFKASPFQSDYVDIWNSNQNSPAPTTKKEKNIINRTYQKIIPLGTKKYLRNLFDIITRKKIYTHDMGIINPKHFEKLKI